MQQSARIAAGLRELGLQRGDRVALLLGNRIEFVLALFAAAHVGLVTVLLGTRQQKPEIAYVLADCGAKLLIHEATLADRLPDATDVPDLHAPHRRRRRSGRVAFRRARRQRACAGAGETSARKTPR